MPGIRSKELRENMFFKKSRREREEDARQSLLKDISNRIDEAKQIPDVAEKYLKLQDTLTAIDETETALRASIRARAEGKGQTLFLGTVGAGTAVGALALVGLHFPPLFILAGPALGWYYGNRAGRDLAYSTEDKLLEENKGFLEGLDTRRSGISSITSEIERTQLRTLAASPKYEEILKKSPKLRDQFAAAFGRQVAAEETPPAPPPKSAHDGFKL